MSLFSKARNGVATVSLLAIIAACGGDSKSKPPTVNSQDPIVLTDECRSDYMLTNPTQNQRLSFPEFNQVQGDYLVKRTFYLVPRQNNVVPGMVIPYDRFLASPANGSILVSTEVLGTIEKLCADNTGKFHYITNPILDDKSKKQAELFFSFIGQPVGSGKRIESGLPESTTFGNKDESFPSNLVNIYEPDLLFLLKNDFAQSPIRQQEARVSKPELMHIKQVKPFAFNHAYIRANAVGIYTSKLGEPISSRTYVDTISYFAAVPSRENFPRN